MADMINLSELSRRTKHNKGYIHRLKTKGILIFDADGLIDHAAAMAAISAAKDPAKDYMKEVNDRQRATHRPEESHHRETQDSSDAQMEPQNSSANSSYMKAKTMREAYAAKTAELEYKEKIGLYILKKEVDAACFEIARSVRDGLINCARRIAADLASAAHPAHECEEVIDREHRALLADMSHSLKTKIDVSVESDIA